MGKMWENINGGRKITEILASISKDGNKQMLRTLSKINCWCLIQKAIVSINYHSFLAIQNELILCKSVKTA